MGGGTKTDGKYGAGNDTAKESTDIPMTETEYARYAALFRQADRYRHDDVGRAWRSASTATHELGVAVATLFGHWAMGST